MPRRATILVAMLAALAGVTGPGHAKNPPSPGDDERYAIRFERPSRVGDRARIKGRGSGHRKVVMIADGVERPLEDVSRSIEIDALREIVAVGAKRRPEHVRFVLGRCDLDMNGSPWKAPEGTRLALKRGGANAETVYEIDGGPVDEDRADALGVLLKLPSGGEVDDDDVFGSKTPRAVGESWNIDSETAARDLEETMPGASVDPKGITGAATLLGVETCEGEKCLRIRVKLVVTGLKLGAAELPPGVTTKSGRITAELEGLFPVREDLPLLRQKMKTSAELVLAGPLAPGQPDVEIRITEVQTQERTLVPQR